MPRHRTIDIRFIRRGQASPSRDDTIRIMRVGENSNRIVYTEHSNDIATVDVMTLTNQQLLSYMYRVFWLTNLDEDPFQYVQFFIPGYPTSIMTIPVLRQNIPTALDLITSTFLNWPIVGQVRDEPVRQSCHSLPIRGPEETSNGGDDGNSSNRC